MDHDGVDEHDDGDGDDDDDEEEEEEEYADDHIDHDSVDEHDDGDEEKEYADDYVDHDSVDEHDDGDDGDDDGDDDDDDDDEDAEEEEEEEEDADDHVDHDSVDEHDDGDDGDDDDDDDEYHEWRCIPCTGEPGHPVHQRAKIPCTGEAVTAGKRLTHPHEGANPSISFWWSLKDGPCRSARRDVQVEEPNSSSCRLEATNTCTGGSPEPHSCKGDGAFEQFENLAHALSIKHMLSFPLLVVCIVLGRSIKGAREDKGGPCDHSPAQHKQKLLLRATEERFLLFRKYRSQENIGPGIGATSVVFFLDHKGAKSSAKLNAVVYWCLLHRLHDPRRNPLASSLPV